MQKMLHPKFFIALFILAFSLSGMAQSQDPVLLKVAGESVTRNEFLKVFEKNNTKQEEISQKALEDYLDLYINFRLKVAEAKALGMDTLKSFRDELAGYRKQLAAPYLVDQQTTDALVRETWEHKQNDLRASHILIRVDRQAPPADTLAAWNKIMKLRSRLLAGEDFGKIAAEASDDPSARDREIQGRMYKGNNGQLGFFTALDMVYPFEKAAYNTPLNEISAPIRTDYGYHILKVTEKDPAIGKIQLAHIIMLPKTNGTVDDSLKVVDSINQAYKFLKIGSDFGEIAKLYSDDFSTATKGGVLPWFSVNRLLPQFVEQIHLLKNKGDYSQPFQSPIGWHIIKLIDQKKPGTFEEEKDEIAKAIGRNDRENVISASFVNKTKSKYGFREYQEAVKELATRVTDSIFNASWKVEEASGLTKPIFSIGQTTYTQADLAKRLATTQKKSTVVDRNYYVAQQYNGLVNDMVVAYADSQLENENPDFKSLVTEYHDGILLFDLMDKKVWTKAVKDTVGLQSYYEQNKNNYLWDERLDASLFTVNDPKLVKKVRKMASKGIADDKILSSLNHDSTINVKVERKKFLKGENMNLQAVEWKAGMSPDVKLADNATTFARVYAVVPPEPKLLSEVRGLMTSDYQNYLEKQWIDELRAKYPFEVNKQVFQSLIPK